MELENIHVAILICTMVGILYADHLAVQYVRGVRPYINASVAKRLHYGVWVGLMGMILTGFFLVQPLWEYYAGEASFYIKMGFVLALIFNSWVIGTLAPLAATKQFQELTSEEKKMLILSGSISGISWVGAAVLGFFFL